MDSRTKWTPCWTFTVQLLCDVSLCMCSKSKKTNTLSCAHKTKYNTAILRYIFYMYVQLCMHMYKCMHSCTCKHTLYIQGKGNVRPKTAHSLGLTLFFPCQLPDENHLQQYMCACTMQAHCTSTHTCTCTCTCLLHVCVQFLPEDTVYCIVHLHVYAYTCTCKHIVHVHLQVTPSSSINVFACTCTCTHMCKHTRTN